MKKIVLSMVFVGVLVLGGIAGFNKIEEAKGLVELAKKDPGTGGLSVGTGTVVAKKDPGTGGL
jgi:hypothetical protein